MLIFLPLPFERLDRRTGHGAAAILFDGWYLTGMGECAATSPAEEIARRWFPVSRLWKASRYSLCIYGVYCIQVWDVVN